ncbi:retrovirus-related pol polyprotein from transposon TNT 1-94 [Tanacetum coccineum]
MSELIAMCVQEEERLKIEKPDTAYLTTTKGHKKKIFKGNKGSNWEKGNSDKASSSNGKESSPKFRFCKNPGYFQKEFPKFQEWLDKKGSSFSYVTYESFFINVPSNTYWIDSGSMVHITNSLRGFFSKRMLQKGERTIRVGDGRSGERSIDLNEKLMDATNQELSIPLYMENSATVTSNEVVDIPIVDAPPHDENPIPPIVQQPLRRSERTRRPIVHDDFITYLSKDDYDLGKVEDPIFYNEAINSNQLTQWLKAMNDELKSMQINDVWELAELPNGYTQKEGIDYNETFSLVSRKDSLRIVMALVAHYDLELHQMDVKTTFLNGDLHEDVYMTQPEGFMVEGKEHMV